MTNPRTPLQRATGQGVETEGIKYPIPSLNMLAVLEQEFGSLEKMGKPGMNEVRMMIFLLEMQKQKKEEQVEIMTSVERKVAAAKLVVELTIDLDSMGNYADAAAKAFTSARSKKKK